MGRALMVLGGPQVREARREDADAIGAILADVGWWDEPATTYADRTAALLPDPDLTDRTLLVAELAGEVVGYLHVTWTHPLFLPGPEGYVTELFVRSGTRGRGVGTALLAAVDDHARRIGAARLELLSSRHREAYARGFYPSHGYEERPRLAVFRRDPRTDLGT